MRTSILAALVVSMLAAPAGAETDWKSVGQVLGKQGAVQAGGIYRVGLPRTDLMVTLDGVEIHPGFALDDEPRLFFMHFWGNDDPQKLVKVLGAALDRVKLAKAGTR